MSQISGTPEEPRRPAGPPVGGQPAQPGQPQYGQPLYGQPQQQYGQAAGTHTGDGPVAEMAPDQQRLWGCLAHLSPIAAALFSASSAGTVYTGALGPLVIYLVLRHRGVFVRRQAAEALNFQILFTVIYLAGILLGVVTLSIGFVLVVPLLIVLGLVFLVFQVIAAVKANQGIDYRYPFNWRLVK